MVVSTEEILQKIRELEKSIIKEFENYNSVSIHSQIELYRLINLWKENYTLLHKAAISKIKNSKDYSSITKRVINVFNNLYIKSSLKIIIKKIKQNVHSLTFNNRYTNLIRQARDFIISIYVFWSALSVEKSIYHKKLLNVKVVEMYLQSFVDDFDSLAKYRKYVINYLDNESEYSGIEYEKLFEQLESLFTKREEHIKKYYKSIEQKNLTGKETESSKYGLRTQKIIFFILNYMITYKPSRDIKKENIAQAFSYITNYHYSNFKPMIAEYDRIVTGIEDEKYNGKLKPKDNEREMIVKMLELLGLEEAKDRFLEDF
jgi:hypothetical protein